VLPLELQIQPGKISEKNKLENQKKIKEAVSTLIARIEEGGRDKLTLNMLIPYFKKLTA